MRKKIIYSVTVSWSELVDFLSEDYLKLLCERLKVDREKITFVPFFADRAPNHITFINEVEDA